MAEKATPVTPEEADDIRVTLDLDNGSVECKIITIFDADHKDYIALLPLDKNGNENESGEVYLYRYFEDERRYSENRKHRIRRRVRGCCRQIR